MLRSFCLTVNANHAIRRANFRILLLGLFVAGAATTLHAQSVKRSVFLQQGPLPGQAVPIPNQLWQQAMLYGQPISYQTQLGVDSFESPQQGSINGEVVEEFTDESFGEDAFDSYGFVRTWANGVPPRLITTQRYSDAYWRFNIDLLALERHNLSEIRQYSTTTPPQATFKSGAPTGGIRISASADLFYSFDLEFAWLGNITWVGRPSNEFDWNLQQPRVYSIPGGSINIQGSNINANGNKTNFSSTLNAFEMNTRFRWVASTAPFTGAWILGTRYVRFTEAAYVNAGANAMLISPASGGATTFTASKLRTETCNNLVGFQGGGELFWTVCRGVMIGGNLKAGVYGNHAVTESVLTDTGLGGEAQYKDSNNVAAFFGDANLMVNAHLGGNWYIRGGYTGLFLSNVSSIVTAVQQDLNSVSAGNTLVANGFYGGLEWKY